MVSTSMAIVDAPTEMQSNESVALYPKKYIKSDLARTLLRIPNRTPTQVTVCSSLVNPKTSSGPDCRRTSVHCNSKVHQGQGNPRGQEARLYRMLRVVC